MREYFDAGAGPQEKPAPTVVELKARCEEVANDLCMYVAMQGTTMELESFMFRCAGKLRGEMPNGHTEAA
jgi:hypothetical protein